MVDRLLASPEYGERWAQHWLDLARFAETDGFEHDLVRPQAWRYRDWVIEALNQDLPYDQFLSLQLAGDLLQPADPAAAIATGFLLCGPDMPDINLAAERRHLVLNEMTSTVGSVFLGLQVGCAQCHDHKFDPITQYDFYRLRAFFNSAISFRDHPIPTAEQRVAHEAAQQAWSEDDRQALARQKHLEELGRQRFRQKNPDELPTKEQQLLELNEAERTEMAQLEERLAGLPKWPDLPMGRVLREGAFEPSHLYLRGDFQAPGPPVESGFPQVLHVAKSTAAGLRNANPSRADLAAWLTRADHPLTSRVVANRVWQWHFGEGLSSTPSDFGVMGDEPAHLVLLDWLAGDLVAHGWSLKRLHRLLVTSRYYRIASRPYDPMWSPEQTTAAEGIWEHSTRIDPHNRWLWRRVPIRLEGEVIRDSMLATSDSLSVRRGGPGVRPPLPAEVRETLLKNHWDVSPEEEDHRRRSVYLFVRRNVRIPLFEVFDRPDSNASCAVRHESITATQSLVLLNSEFSLDCATRLAEALRRAFPEDSAAQIDGVYLRVLNRPASGLELRRAGEFLQRHPAHFGEQSKVAPLVDLCLALFNANEFIYLD